MGPWRHNLGDITLRYLRHCSLDYAGLKGRYGLTTIIGVWRQKPVCELFPQAGRAHGSTLLRKEQAIHTYIP